MPYISGNRRVQFETQLQELFELLDEENSVGEYNYIITRFLHHYIHQNGCRYQHLNNIVGVIECAKQEFLRTVVGPYEDKKRKENGAVSDLDFVK